MYPRPSSTWLPKNEAEYDHYHCLNDIHQAARNCHDQAYYEQVEDLIFLEAFCCIRWLIIMGRNLLLLICNSSPACWCFALFLFPTCWVWTHLQSLHSDGLEHSFLVEAWHLQIIPTPRQTPMHIIMHRSTVVACFSIHETRSVLV